jgi:hypothetical protein
VNCVLLALIFARLFILNHKKRRPSTGAQNDDAGQPAARDYESPDRIGMIAYEPLGLSPNSAQEAVNYSNSLDF